MKNESNTEANAFLAMFGIPVAIAAALTLFFELTIPANLHAARPVDVDLKTRTSPISDVQKNTAKYDGPTSLKGAQQLRAAQEALMKEDGPGMANLRSMLLDD